MTAGRWQAVRTTEKQEPAAGPDEPDEPDEPQVSQGEGLVAVPTGRSLRFNVSALAISQGITWSVGIVSTMIVPRLLGPYQLGILVVALSATGILGIVVGLGTAQYLVREIVARPGQARSLLGTALVLRTGLAPVFGAATIAWVQLAHYGSQEALIVYLVAGSAILRLLAEPFQALFQAMERMEYMAYSDVLVNSAAGLAGVVLVLIGFRAVGLATCAVFIGVVVFIMNAWWGRSLVLPLRTNFKRVRSMASESLPYWASGLVFMIYTWIDSVILSFMAPAVVVGWYGSATKLFGTLLFLPVLLGKAWLPRLVRGHEQGQNHLRQAARAPLELVVVLSVPVSVATAVGARPVMHLLYGRAYDHAVPVMVILAFCALPMYASIILYQVLVAEKRPHVWGYVMAGGCAVNVLLNVVLIRYFQTHSKNGAIGAAVSLLITELLIFAAGHVIVGRHVLNARSSWRVARTALAAAAMWGVASAARPWGAVLSLTAAGLVFVLLAALLGVASAEERELIRVLPTRVWGRLRRSSSQRRG